MARPVSHMLRTSDSTSPLDARGARWPWPLLVWGGQGITIQTNARRQYLVSMDAEDGPRH
jgi:hypothetical protein